MENETVYLNFVLDKLKQRIQKINQSLMEGEKEIEGMHEYYWENYTEMDQYGYENFDNQQALLTQINTNQEQLKLKYRFKKINFFTNLTFIYLLKFFQQFQFFSRRCKYLLIIIFLA